MRWPPIDREVRSGTSFLQVILFLVAVGGVGTASVLAHRRPAGNRPVAGRVTSAVRNGWLLFILLATIAGIAEPLMACRLLVRAYLLRARILYNARRGSPPPNEGASGEPAPPGGRPAHGDVL